MSTMPTEDLIMADLATKIRSQIPELEDRVVDGPIAEAPLQLTVILYFDQVTIEWSGVEDAFHDLAIIVAIPDTIATTSELKALVNGYKYRIYQTLKAGTILGPSDTEGAIITGPFTITGAQINTFRPGGVDGIISAEIRFRAQSLEGMQYATD